MLDFDDPGPAGRRLFSEMLGTFLWRRCFGYVVAQLVGATLACLFLLAVLGGKGKLGATLPGEGIHDWQAMLFCCGVRVVTRLECAPVRGFSVSARRENTRLLVGARLRS